MISLHLRQLRCSGALLSDWTYKPSQMKQRLKNHFLAATHTARVTSPARAANRFPGRTPGGRPPCRVCARRSQSAVWLRLPHDRGPSQAGRNPAGGGVEMSDASGRGFKRAAARGSKLGHDTYDQSPIVFCADAAVIFWRDR